MVRSNTVKPIVKLKFNILPDVEDIALFLSAGDQKSKNDEYNKIRENVLTNIFNIDDEYLNHPQYGDSWIDIKDKFTASMTTLCSEPFEKMSIKHMGGMSKNHDFDITFHDNKNIIKTEKLEFKHNNSNVYDLVQFLELYDKDCKHKYNVCSVSYSEYYYDNGIDKYLITDDELILPKPTKEDYLKHVYDIKYKYPFFKHLHDKKNNKTKEKKEIANESVKKYIEEFHSTFNFEKITEKIIESQKDKVFLLWDCKNFHIQKLEVSNIKINKIKKVDNLYFDVIVDNFSHDIRVRLNWGNSNGLCNPRWKFSFIDK